MTDPAKSPLVKPSRGRKSLQGGGNSPVFSLKLTPEQKAKVLALGGANWVREKIDKA